MWKIINKFDALCVLIVLVVLGLGTALLSLHKEQQQYAFQCENCNKRYHAEGGSVISFDADTKSVMGEVLDRDSVLHLCNSCINHPCEMNLQRVFTHRGRFTNEELPEIFMLAKLFREGANVEISPNIPKDKGGE